MIISFSLQLYSTRLTPVLESRHLSTFEDDVEDLLANLTRATTSKQLVNALSTSSATLLI
jgi:hypothetical protein